MFAVLNWYTKRYRFPKRGWKYIQPLLRATGLATRTYTKKLFNGSLFFANATDHIQKSIFWYGSYESEMSRLWQRFVHRKSYVVDIGANIGYFSLLAAAKAAAGRVYAFEPVSNLRQQFESNFRLNQLENYTLLPYCVGSEEDTTKIYVAAGDNAGMSSLRPPENFSGQTETIQQVVLDKWLEANPLPRLDLVKIDIEGSEKHALEGMAHTLEKYRPVVFIEVKEELLAKFGVSPGEIYDILYRHNYRSHKIVDASTLKIISPDPDVYDVVFIPDGRTLPAGITLLT